ncbi:MAG: LamG-like jellyroll fold domain-containing protein, partial [Nanoarchaeota archaeon]
PIQFDGTAGTPLNSSTVSTTVASSDSTGPTIVNVTPNGTKFLSNVVVNITANVTDASSVDTVFANITLPNGSTRRLTMANASSTIYRTNFSETSLNGTYNITIIANDTVNNIGTLGGANFSVNSSPVVARVNITPFTPNSSTSVAGVWNFTDADNDVENGSTWTWFVNSTEMWRDASLVGFWKLDSNALDTSTRGNNGTITRAVNLSSGGLIKGSFNFNGTQNGGSVDMGDVLDDVFTATNATFSIATWVKMNGSAAQFQFFVSKFADGLVSESQRQLFLATSSGTLPTNISFAWYGGLGTSETVWHTTAFNIQPAEWVHVAVTYNGSLARFNKTQIYINGLRDPAPNDTARSSGNPANIPNGNASLALGSSMNSGRTQSAYNMNGTIDEVRIYNKTLTSEEITNLYWMMDYGSSEKDAKGTPAQDIPIAAWHFDDAATSTSMFDFFGDSIGVMSNVSRVSGMFGTNGLQFNRTNAMIVVNHSQVFNLSGNFTFFAWINDTEGGSNMYVLSKHEHSTLSSFAVLVNNSQVSCLVGNATGLVGAVGGGLLGTGTWNQIGCVYNSTTLGVIANGEIRSTTASVGVLNVTANALYLGSVNGTGNFFNGTIDEVELYNRPFSVDEINQSFRRGFPLFGLNTSRFGANDSLTFQIEALQYDGTAGTPVNSSTVTTTLLPPPVILNVTPNGTSFSANGTINISANVTDDVSVDTVFANITLPNGSTRRITMLSIGNLYRTNFSETGTTGLYDLTIIANDSSDTTATATSNFTITEARCDNLTASKNLTGSASTAGTCMQVNANNVVVDCNGFSVTGSAAAAGINASGRRNVTIQNCKILNFSIGIDLTDSNNSVIANSSILNTTTGILLRNISNISIRDNIFGNTTTALWFVRSSGIIINQSFGNILGESLHVSDGLGIIINTTIFSANVTLENLTSNASQIIYMTTVDLTNHTNFSLLVDLRTNFALANATQAPRLNRSAVIRFNSSTASGTTPLRDANDNGVFVRCLPSICTTLSTSGGFVVFNISGFSTYKLGSLANISNTPSGFNITDVNGNVITDFESGTTVQLRNGSKRLIEFTILNGTNLSYLSVSQNATAAAISGWNQTVNVSSTHALFIPNNNQGAGIFICPNAFLISQVTKGCANEVAFTSSLPQTLNTAAGTVTVSIDGSDYKISGLNQSGGGNNPTPAGLANASDVAGAQITVNKSERFNGTAAGVTVTQGGNTTQINFTTNISTNKWTGFYGNTSGSTILGAGKQSFFDFGNVTPLFIAITQDINFNFVNIRAANTSLIDKHFSFNENDTDSANKTFNASGKKIAGITGVPFAILQSGAWYSGVFDNSSANNSIGDPRFYAFGVEVNASQTDFAGGTSDFELLVGTNATSDNSRNTVYFFMDIQ